MIKIQEQTMIKAEFIKRSPLRLLEKSTHGGVGIGNIGVIAGPKGSGKTACLVHLATDQLFQDKHVIHVSFSNDTGHIVSWYEDIFTEIARRGNLDNSMSIHDEIVRNRIILNFRQDGVHVEQIEKSLTLLMQSSNFKADTVVIDKYDFSKASDTELNEFHRFAADLNIQIWFSASVSSEEDTPDHIPAKLKRFLSDIAIIIRLRPYKDIVHFELVKDHDVVHAEQLRLELDSKILLINEVQE